MTKVRLLVIVSINDNARPFREEGAGRVVLTNAGQSDDAPSRIASRWPMKGAATFRRLIAGQVRTTKAAWPVTVECERCGTTIAKADAHADHVPTPFAALVRRYLDWCSATKREITAADWQAFHRDHATLKPSCASCNIAANPRGTSWTRRRGWAA
jgi:hypothetical protein